MIRQERAKQFAPFDALKGLSEALRAQEELHSRVEKHDINEEQIEKNSAVFLKLEKGMLIRIDCYRFFHEVTLTGHVTEINLAYRFLRLGREKIPFADIYDIEIL